jgi:hypothetical protein
MTMSDLKFACPHCQQHIQCESGYAGMQIACPACANSLVVPGQAPAPVPVPVPARIPGLPPTPTAANCPNCHAPLSRGAAVCLKCGYNLVTGQRSQSRTGVGAGRPAAAASEGWATNPSVWAGILIGVFGLLYVFARTSPVGAMVFVGLALLFYLGISITVLVFAFKESAGTGFMTLCIPFYALYFVYGLNDNPMLKALYSVALLVMVAIRTLKGSFE